MNERRCAVEKQIGRVTHFFGKAGVAAIELEGELEVGDTIHVEGHTSDWNQRVDSIQIEHEAVEKAGPGDVVGLKVDGHAREHDVVYKVVDE
jgi:translation elongation factor EF-1alpha